MNVTNPFEIQELRELILKYKTEDFIRTKNKCNFDKVIAEMDAVIEEGYYSLMDVAMMRVNFWGWHGVSEEENRQLLSEIEPEFPDWSEW